MWSYLKNFYPTDIVFNLKTNEKQSNKAYKKINIQIS